MRNSNAAAFYGILFPGSEEAAFSNFRLFEATGSVIAYVLSPMLCTGTKLTLLLGLLVVGMTGYVELQFFSRFKYQLFFFSYSILEYMKRKEDRVSSVGSVEMKETHRYRRGSS